MKKISLLILVVLLTSHFSCERDDICPETTSTTPRLIIDLYDFSNQEEKKNVIDFRVQGVDNDEVLPDYNVIKATNNIILPLRTDTNKTEYMLHIDYAVNDNGTPDNTDDDFTEGNQDIISINYTTEEVYVSRACGYKTIFKNVTLSIVSDNDNWIKLKESVTENQSVEDETTTHFNLYH
ncbi:DUF6452 family protein [Aestuariivivens insulae]|uniref:DUF6452 family protein n=1 Tax=Aestuariivivens insulae TaxID=1621988 RepID=UPI001F55CE54|nr:DUF6452 family protein [Aestuariivivens insulae]